MVKKVAIIPARYGSSRLPGKPLLDIHGQPMICHVYRRTASISFMDSVAVATDDERIAECIRAMGGDVFLTDPEHESGTDRIAQVAREMGLSPDTIVVNIQGDQPLISPEPVLQMVELLEQNRELDMATAACPMHPDEVDDPNRVKVVLDSSYRALYFSRSRIPFDRDGSAPSGPGYLRHIGIYAYSNRFLQKFVDLPASWLENMEKLEQLRALENGFNIGVAVVDQAPLDVDTEADLEKVRNLMVQGS